MCLIENSKNIVISEASQWATMLYFVENWVFHIAFIFISVPSKLTAWLVAKNQNWKTILLKKCCCVKVCLFSTAKNIHFPATNYHILTSNPIKRLNIVVMKCLLHVNHLLMPYHIKKTPSVYYFCLILRAPLIFGCFLGKFLGI